MKNKLLTLTALLLAAGLATTQSYAQSDNAGNEYPQSKSAKSLELPDSEARARTYVTDEEEC